MKSKSYTNLILFTLFALFLSIFETLAYKKAGAYSIIASRIWIIWTIYFLICCLIILVKTFWRDIKEKNFWGIFTLLLVTFLISIKLTDFPLNISGESTQQMAAVHKNITANDLNYTKTAFLSNPSRQYLLAGWTSIFFGRSITNYRLGYLSIFLLGLYMFYSGTRINYSNNNYIAGVIGLGILGLLAFPILPLLLRVFEQISIPLALSSLALGWYQITLKKLSFRNLTAFLWTLTMLSTSYVPSLSPWVLLNLALLIIIFRNLIRREWFVSIILVLCLSVAIVFCVNSLQNRADLRLSGQKDNILQQLNKLPDVFSYVFVRDSIMYDNQISFLGKLMFLPTVTYFVGALLFIWGLKHFTLAGWVIASLIIAGITPGYANSPVAFVLQKAIFVFPFIIWAMLDLVNSYKLKIKKTVLFLLFTVFSLYDILIVYSIYKQSNIEYDLRSIVLRETLQTTSAFSIPLESPIILATYTQYPPFQFFADHLRYFYPNAKLMSSADCPKEIASPALIYIDKNHKCYRQIIESASSPNYKIFPIQYQIKEIKNSIKSDDLNDIQKIVVN